MPVKASNTEILKMGKVNNFGKHSAASFSKVVSRGIYPLNQKEREIVKTATSDILKNCRKVSYGEIKKAIHKVDSALALKVERQVKFHDGIKRLGIRQRNLNVQRSQDAKEEMAKIESDKTLFGNENMSNMSMAEKREKLRGAVGTSKPKTSAGGSTNSSHGFAGANNNTSVSTGKPVETFVGIGSVPKSGGKPGKGIGFAV